jgi:hypothetical protein
MRYLASYKNYVPSIATQHSFRNVDVIPSMFLLNGQFTTWTPVSPRWISHVSRLHFLPFVMKNRA